MTYRGRIVVLAWAFYCAGRATSSLAIPYLAVLPPSLRGDLPKGIDAGLLADLIRAAARRSGREGVLTGENIFTVLREQGIDPARCGDSECAVDQGRALGATEIVLTKIQRTEDTTYVLAELYDVEAGTLKKVAERDCGCERAKDLVASVREAAQELFGGPAGQGGGGGKEGAPAGPGGHPGGCVPIPRGMIAWWSADGALKDSVTGLGGRLRGGARVAPGKVGAAFWFDGKSGYFEAPGVNLGGASGGEFSILLWVVFRSFRPETDLYHPQAVLVGDDEGPENRRKWFLAYGGGNLYFHLNGPTLGPRFLVVTPFHPLLDRWYLVGLTRENGRYALYVDAALVAEERNAAPLPEPQAPLTLGQAESTPGGRENFFLDGGMDEVQLYHRALTPAEIQDVYSAGSRGICRSREGAVPPATQGEKR